MTWPHVMRYPELGLVGSKCRTKQLGESKLRKIGIGSKNQIHMPKQLGH